MKAMIANSPMLQNVTVANTLTLSDSLTGTNEYLATQTIFSTQVINSGSIAYKAGTQIILLPGFQATASTAFSAMIEDALGCKKTTSTRFIQPLESSDDEKDRQNLQVKGFDNHRYCYFYPNPNSGTFQIDTNFPLTDIANLKVINLLGVPVYETQNLSSNTIQLPTSASGQHFVVIILNDGSVLTQKMMVQR